MISSCCVCAQEKGGTTSAADKESESGDVLHSSHWPVAAFHSGNGFCVFRCFGVPLKMH